jgi:hypothetical protein
MTLSPGNDSFDKMSRVPSLDPSSHARISMSRPVSTETTCVSRRSIVARSL